MIAPLQSDVAELTHGIQERDAELSRLRAAAANVCPKAAVQRAAPSSTAGGSTAEQEVAQMREASAAGAELLPSDGAGCTAAQELASARDEAAAAAERHQSINALVEQVPPTLQSILQAVYSN